MFNSAPSDLNQKQKNKNETLYFYKSLGKLFHYQVNN